MVHGFLNINMRKCQIKRDFILAREFLDKVKHPQALNTLDSISAQTHAKYCR